MLTECLQHSFSLEHISNVIDFFFSFLPCHSVSPHVSYFETLKNTDEHLFCLNSFVYDSSMENVNRLVWSSLNMLNESIQFPKKRNRETEEKKSNQNSTANDRKLKPTNQNASISYGAMEKFDKNITKS